MYLIDVLRLFFLIAWLAACGFGWGWGGRPERLGAATMFWGAIVSIPAAMIFGSQWTHPEYGVFLVDLVVLGALIALMLAFDRFWLIWATSSQLIAVTIHIVTMVDHGFLPKAYAIAQPFWAYPALIALTVGTVQARGRRQALATRSRFSAESSGP